MANEKPQEPSFHNVNLQMLSSWLGTRLIEEHFKNVKYVLKTRTDMRINMPDFMLYFKNLLRIYPVADNKLEARLAFLSADFAWNHPFYVCDYMSFGTVNDIKKLYQPREPQFNEPADFFLNAEVYIMRTFYKAYIAPLPRGTEANAYFGFLKKYAVMSDVSTLKIQWPKYFSARHRWMYHQTFMDHAKWLNYCYCENPGVKIKYMINGTVIDINF